MERTIIKQGILLLTVQLVLVVAENGDVVNFNAQTKAELFITSRLDWSKILGLVEDQLNYFATGKVEHFTGLGVSGGRSGFAEYIWHKILNQTTSMDENEISDMRRKGEYAKLEFINVYIRLLRNLCEMPTSDEKSDESTTGYFNLEGLLKSLRKIIYRTIRNLQDKFEDLTRLREFAANLKYDLGDPHAQKHLNNLNRRMDTTLEVENPLDVLKTSGIMDESELYRIEHAIKNVGPLNVTKALSEIIKNALPLAKSDEANNGENSVEVK